MLVVIEGIDMSGKSTQTKMLKERLIETGGTVETFHFPTKLIFGKEIYRHYNGEVSYTQEELELLHTIDKMSCQAYIEHCLSGNDFLLLDRYKLSQFVYAISQGVDEEWAKALISRMIEPDIGFLLDLPMEEAMRRKEMKDKNESNYELLKKTRRNYFRTAMEWGYKIIDANRSASEINDDIFYTIKYLEGY